MRLGRVIRESESTAAPERSTLPDLLGVLFAALGARYVACMRIEPEALYHQLGHLVATVPDLSYGQCDTTEVHQWLARVCALVDASGDPIDAGFLRNACDGLDGGVLHDSNVHRIITIVYRALARAELAAPTSAQGTYIPAGGSFTALAAVSKILGSAKTSVLMVDPYADAILLTEFAVLAPEGVEVHVLADATFHKPGLEPAAKYWAKQFGLSRPLDVRLASPKSLHDRLILVDSRDAFTLGQSFNALASRAPTSLVRADSETARLKVAAYNDIWTAAVPLI